MWQELGGLFYSFSLILIAFLNVYAIYNYCFVPGKWAMGKGFCFAIATE